ncbi:MAG: DegV family protein [Clostridiales bacterium]|nr:MAG: DegV family protein [Clostridiales bacterium]
MTHFAQGRFPRRVSPTPKSLFETLEPYVKAGNDVLHIAFSSGMSGSFNSACIAATELMEKNIPAAR